MEEALLHGDIFNIEAKRLELEDQQYSRKEIKNILETRYRSLSKKKAFTCRCCDEPVNMNLTKDEGRPFYFKHYDGQACAYSENSVTYDRQVSEHQDKNKKDIGLTVFKEILEGQLKPLGAVIERGYFYKKKLSFIPDLIIHFPHTNTIWAVDYYTSLSAGSYTHQLDKRMKIYRSEGFRAFSFIDETWLALDRETNKGTLLEPELEVTRKSKEDIAWDHFLSSDLPSDMKEIVSEVTNLTIPVDTRSIAYVNTDSRSCEIIRLIPTQRNQRNVTFYAVSNLTIQLERALTLNSNKDDFLLFKDHEEESQLTFLHDILDKKARAEQEEKARREELERLQREEAEQQAVLDILKLEAQERFASVPQFKSADADEEQVDQEMARRAEEARERPVDMSPEQWEWFRKTGRVYPSRDSRSVQRQSRSSYAKEDSYTIRQREKFLELLLTHPIHGDQYIDGPPSKWRGSVLKWIKVHEEDGNLVVSMDELLRDMKGDGITFIQSDVM